MPRRYIVGLAIFIPVLFLTFVLVGPCSQVATLVLQSLFHLPSSNAATNQAEDLLNVINVFAAIFGVLLTAATVIAGVLGFVGFSTVNDIRRSQEQIRKTVTDLDTVKADFERQKNELSDFLQKATRDAEDTKNALTYLIRGGQLMEEQKIDQAIESLDNAKKLRPKDPQINYDLGLAYSRKGLYDQAIACFQTATESDPTFSQAWLDLGLNYRHRGSHQSSPEQRKDDFARAEEYLWHAARSRSNYWEAYGTLGGLYRRMGNYERALECYLKAYNLDATTSYGPGNIACLYFYLGKSADAHEYFQETEKLAQERITLQQSREPYWDYYDLAIAQFMLGSLDKREDLKEEAMNNYTIAIAKTTRREAFDGVLDNLYLLQKSEHCPPDLAQTIKLIENARLHFSLAS
ncbi:MAG TPA: tetratricopeptide repeat protein [Ktedonobacteraceae bacterium]